VISAYIGLGSNLGDSLTTVLRGWAALGAVPGITLGRLSHPYRTEPVDMISDNWFVNAAGELKTSLAPLELLATLHRVEEQFGRVREREETAYRDRTLDFDLLLYGGSVIRDPAIQVPHPHLPDRLFVLLPLCEIAGELTHPVLGRKLLDLLADLRSREKGSVVEMMQWPAQGPVPEPDQDRSNS